MTSRNEQDLPLDPARLPDATDRIDKAVRPRRTLRGMATGLSARVTAAVGTLRGDRPAPRLAATVAKAASSDFLSGLETAFAAAETEAEKHAVHKKFGKYLDRIDKTLDQEKTEPFLRKIASSNYLEQLESSHVIGADALEKLKEEIRQSWVRSVSYWDDLEISTPARVIRAAVAATRIPLLENAATDFLTRFVPVWDYKTLDPFVAEALLAPLLGVKHNAPIGGAETVLAESWGRQIDAIANYHSDRSQERPNRAVQRWALVIKPGENNIEPIMQYYPRLAEERAAHMLFAAQQWNPGSPVIEIARSKTSRDYSRNHESISAFGVYTSKQAKTAKPG